MIQDKLFEPTSPYIFVTLFCWLYALAYNGLQAVRLMITSLVTALIMTLPFIGGQIYHDSGAATFVCAFPLMMYMAHSFHYAYHVDNRWPVSYPSLFSAVWNTLPLLITAAIFATLAKGLIFLSALSFQALGSDTIYNLYMNMDVWFIGNITLLFIGLGIAHQNIHIINSMRFLLLRIMYYLFPLLALVSILYCILFVAHHVITTLSYTSLAHTNLPFPVLKSLSTLCSFVILGILFFNASFQDGEVACDYSKIMHYFFKIYRVALFILASFMTYQMFYYIPLNLNAMVLVIFSLLYCSVYAWTAFLSPPKDRTCLLQSNIYLALCFIVILLVINNPIMPLGHLSSTPVSPLETISLSPFATSSELQPAPSQKTIEYFNQQRQKMDGALAKEGIRWEPHFNKNTYQVKTQDKPLSLCRTVYKQGLEIGVYQQNRCTITYAGTAIQEDTFVLLSHADNKLIWTSKKNKGLALALEYIPHALTLQLNPDFKPAKAMRPLMACMVNDHGVIRLGKAIPNVCYVDISGVEKHFGHYKVLALDPARKGKKS
ncbi:MAG: hypothetical protein Q8R79_07070 [Legionellaceae bacterium]|nr:hypothetical protein [Legionellaceae bacterium]